MSAFALMSLVAVDASAASVCERLRSKLNNATETIGNTQSARKYATAISQQNQQIRKLRSDLSRMHCAAGNSSVVVFGADNTQSCGKLTKVLSKMEKNLQVLRSRKDTLVKKSLSTSARKRILASLEANGCNDLITAAPKKREKAVTNYASRDVTDEQVKGSGSVTRYALSTLGGANGGGHLQTVCVRTCDGAFFPISSSSKPQQFARDAQVCSMMCPGMTTQLFYHSVSSEESNQMISTIDGTPYIDMPFAYKYRNSPAGGTKSCSCNFSAFYKEMMRRESGKPLDNAKTSSYSSITQIGSEMSLRESLPAEGPKKEKVELRPYDPDQENIRRIGPQFMPEAASFDLHAPLETPSTN